MYEPECIANELKRRVGLDTGEPVDPRIIAYRLKLELVPSPPRGCLEALDEGRIYYDPNDLRTIFHALGHHALRLAGLPVNNERHAIEIAARLAVPMPAFKRALRSGMGRHALAAQFGINETCAALRYGEATGEPVAVVTPTKIYAAGEWPWPAADVLRRMLRERHRGLKQERMRDPRRVLVRVAK